MNKVWLIIKEEDWFYDDKYYDYLVFDSYESARKYYDDYVEITLFELEKDYNSTKRDDYDDFDDAIEVDYYNNNQGTRIFLDDAYYINIEIHQKDVMSMN